MAIKFLASPSLDLAAPAVKEALLGACLAHPNIIKTYTTRVARIDTRAVAHLRAVAAAMAAAAAMRRQSGAGSGGVLPSGGGSIRRRSHAPTSTASPSAAAAAAAVAAAAMRRRSVAAMEAAAGSSGHPSYGGLISPVATSLVGSPLGTRPPSESYAGSTPPLSPTAAGVLLVSGVASGGSAGGRSRASGGSRGGGGGRGGGGMSGWPRHSSPGDSAPVERTQRKMEEPASPPAPQPLVPAPSADSRSCSGAVGITSEAASALPSSSGASAAAAAVAPVASQAAAASRAAGGPRVGFMRRSVSADAWADSPTAAAAAAAIAAVTASGSGRGAAEPDAVTTILPVVEVPTSDPAPPSTWAVASAVAATGACSLSGSACLSASASTDYQMTSLPIGSQAPPPVSPLPLQASPGSFPGSSHVTLAQAASTPVRLSPTSAQHQHQHQHQLHMQQWPQVPLLTQARPHHPQQPQPHPQMQPHQQQPHQQQRRHPQQQFLLPGPAAARSSGRHAGALAAAQPPGGGGGAAFLRSMGGAGGGGGGFSAAERLLDVLHAVGVIGPTGHPTAELQYVTAVVMEFADLVRGGAGGEGLEGVGLRGGFGGLCVGLNSGGCSEEGAVAFGRLRLGGQGLASGLGPGMEAALGTSRSPWASRPPLCAYFAPRLPRVARVRMHA